MREILFRGKRLDNGEWVEGMPIKTHIGVYMVYEENPHFCSQYGYMEIDGICPVDPETVGQYTGLTDENGKEIFEGDILEFIDEYGAPYHITVVFNGGAFCIKDGDIIDNDLISRSVCLGLKVVGNIHDNPELIAPPKEVER